MTRLSLNPIREGLFFYLFNYIFVLLFYLTRTQQRRDSKVNYVKSGISGDG